MRGTDETSRSLFSYVDLEDRLPVHYPLRKIRHVVNNTLSRLNTDCSAVYVEFGRLSIAADRLIQILLPIRSGRPLME